MKDNSLKQLIKEMVEQGIVDAIGDGVSIQDTQFKILYENKVHKDIIGDHLGEYCYKAYQKKDDVCEGCPLFMTFKDGKIHTREWNNIIDNEERLFDITASPLKDSKGKIIAGIEIVRDITERKRNEEALKISEEKYRLLFSTEKDAIIIVDAESLQIMDGNDSALHLYGYSKEEFLKLTGPDLSAEPEKSEAAIRKITSLPNQRVHFHTRNHKKKDGTVFPVEISSGTFTLKGRKIISAVIRDVTERQEILETLVKSSFYLDNVNDTLIVLNAKTEIIKVNKEFTNLWGYSSEEILGKPVSKILPEEEVPKHLSEMKKAVSTKKPRYFETVALAKSGEKVPLYIRGSAFFDKDGKPEGFFGIFRDITERKQAEEILKESEQRQRMQAEELSESNTALRVLLKQRENDRREFEENILSNIKHLILPYIGKLKKNREMAEGLSYLNILESNLNEIISPFSTMLSSNYLGFTPKEIQIANLIKDGKQDKDIMETLNISKDTAKTHRQNIRKKLGIYGKRTNLRTYLLTVIK